jgi:hypothetical protein
METILGSRRDHHLASVCVPLIMAALIAGTAGCVPLPSQIYGWYDLDAVRDNLNGSYILMNDLDSTTAGYEELAAPNGNEGMGWLPIGTEDDAFAGSLDGQGYEIRDLFMIGSGLSHVGVFGFVGEEGQIEDIGVVDAVVVGDEVAGGLVGVCYGTVTNSYSIASVYGHEYAGGLVGICNGTVANSYSTSNVSGESNVGCLVGWNGNEGTVSNSYSSGDVTGFVIGVGGLVGWNEGTVTNSYAMGTVTCSAVIAGGLVGVNEGTVTNSHSTGSVTGDMEVGGLVGQNGWYMDGYSNPGTVTDSYSTGSVTCQDDAGGLVGGNGYESIVSDSYATGNVNGDRSTGGLVGINVGSVADSYSTGNVTGNSSVGGLVGEHRGTVTNSYSAGNVTGDVDVGGLVGLNWEGTGTVSNSFWDTQTSGQSTSAGGTGKTTVEMQDVAIFSGARWNIRAVATPDTPNRSYVWNIVEGVTYPFLSWQA